MIDCDHPGVWKLRSLETEPVIVIEIRCAVCDALVWVGSEHAGIRAETGELVRLK